MHTFNIAFIVSCVTLMASARPMDLYPRAPASAPPTAADAPPTQQIVVNGGPHATPGACTDPVSCPTNGVASPQPGDAQHPKKSHKVSPNWQKEQALITIIDDKDPSDQSDGETYYLRYTQPITLSDAIIYTVVDEYGKPTSPRMRAKIPTIPKVTETTPATPATPPDYTNFVKEIGLTRKVTEEIPDYVVKRVASGTVQSENQDLNNKPILITRDVKRAIMAKQLAANSGSRDKCWDKSREVAKALMTAYEKVSKVTPVHQDLLKKSLLYRARKGEHKGEVVRAFLFDWDLLDGQAQLKAGPSTVTPPSQAELMKEFQEMCDTNFLPPGQQNAAQPPQTAAQLAVAPKQAPTPNPKPLAVLASVPPTPSPV